MEKKPWKSSAKNPREYLKVHYKGSDFMDYEKVPELANILEGKKIAFVGPSPHLTGTGSGELIDSYDIIIRPGQMTNIPKNKKKDIGSRTDIICHSFNTLERDEALKHIDFFKELQYIICSMVSGGDLKQQENLFPKLIAPVHNVEDRYLLKRYEEVGTILNCGYAGLLTILNYDIKEIYVTGMSFYNMGKYGDIYYDDYMEVVRSSGIMKKANKKNITPKDARDDLHNQIPQIEHLKSIAKENPELIKLDKYLTEKLFKDEKDSNDSSKTGE